jgi:thiol-disulfide isomerase/thioredoxin
MVKTEKQKEIKLFSIENGAVRVLASTQMGPDGTYGFLFVPDSSGFYAVGTDRINHPVYVNPGDEINLNLEEEEEIAVLTGKNTPENMELYKWLDFSRTVRQKSTRPLTAGVLSSYEDFFPDLEKLATETENFKKAIHSANPSFDRSLRTMIDYDMDLYALTFLYTPRSIQPEKSDRTPYYQTIISENKFASDNILQYPDGLKLLSLYLTFIRIEKEVFNTQPIDFDLEFIANPVLKGEFLLAYLKRIKTYDRYEAFMHLYEKYLVTSEQKKSAEQVGSNLYESAPGKSAPAFSYPDVAGKEHSLSDYRGKVVLIDVWATWCGPCRKEFPSLKKLEEEMRDKEIVFMGISINALKDKEKWAKMVETENLPGIQLLAGPEDKLSKDYKINAIPRYIVIDKQGNIVSADAPRPSDADLKILLEKELRN